MDLISSLDIPFGTVEAAGEPEAGAGAAFAVSIFTRADGT